MSSFWMPKKQPLYAPMLSTFGGGSARGFNPGGGGGDFDSWSINFPNAGSNNYVTAASSTDFGLGTGDYTLEWWHYQTVDDWVLVFDQDYGNTQGLSVWIDPSQAIDPYMGDGNTRYSQATPNNVIKLNTWHHIAVVRDGSSVKIYVDGVSKLSSTTLAANLGTQSQPFSIASAYGNNDYQFDGYLAQIRLVKGTAVYTSNFTPPETPLTAISGTVLLTAQDSTIVDNSSTGRTLTVTGTVTPTQSNVPFPIPSETIVTDGLIWHVDAANSSSYSGSGTVWSDLIGSEDVDLYGSPTYSNSAANGGGAFQFTADSSYATTTFTRNNDAFSVSAWYKPDNPQADESQHCLMNTFESASAEWWSLSLQFQNNPTPQWIVDNDGAKVEIQADSGGVNSDWQLITGTRSGSTMKLYVNGDLRGTSTSLTSTTVTGVEPIWIASRSNGSSGPSETYGGWISDLKMYSKELSASEVMQNYNALKGRY
jgi:hypothetical protein